jgi:hypothetical protein
VKFGKWFMIFPFFGQKVELVSSFDDLSKKLLVLKPNWLHPQFKKPNNKISKIHN